MQGHVCVPRSNPQGRGRQQGSAHSPQTAPSLKELPKPRRAEPGRMFCSLKGGPAPPPTDSSRTEIPPREAPGAPAAAAASPHPRHLPEGSPAALAEPPGPAPAPRRLLPRPRPLPSGGGGEQRAAPQARHCLHRRRASPLSPRRSPDSAGSAAGGGAGPQEAPPRRRAGLGAPRPYLGGEPARAGARQRRAGQRRGRRRPRDPFSPGAPRGWGAPAAVNGPGRGARRPRESSPSAPAAPCRRKGGQRRNGRARAYPGLPLAPSARRKERGPPPRNALPSERPHNERAAPRHRRASCRTPAALCVTAPQQS